MYRYVYSMFFCKKVGECPTYSGHLAMLVWENVISTIIRYPLPKHFQNFQRKSPTKIPKRCTADLLIFTPTNWYDMIWYYAATTKKTTHLADYMSVLYIQVWIISGQSWNTKLHRNSSWCPWFFFVPSLHPAGIPSVHFCAFKIRKALVDKNRLAKTITCCCDWSFLPGERGEGEVKHVLKNIQIQNNQIFISWNATQAMNGLDEIS